MKIDEIALNFLNILRKLSGIVVLLFIFAPNLSCHADVPRCFLKNGQEGECKPLRECKKVIFSLRQGVDPEYCNYERESVCCAVSLRDDPVQHENERYEPPHSSRTPKQRLNRPSDPYITISDIYDSSFANDERRRSNIQRSGRPDVARINDQDSERSYLYENTPNNVYNDRERGNSPEHSDDLTNRRYYNGYNVENSFVPPGLAKKKPWVGEKTTESYYEYLTKKPNRIQGPKEPNKQHNNNHHPPGHQPYPQRTTRRPESVAYPNEWHNGPSQYPNSNINNNQNQWSTTRRNKWNQETTTIRNHHLTNVPNNPNGWPHRTSTESIRNKPSLFQQGSRPQENRPVSRPGTHGKIRTSELKCQEYSKEITENITGLPLTTDPNPVIIPVRKCVQAQQLIVGGENTTIGEFPHMAAIGFRNRNNQGISWNCGGTLISDLFVLTAAHCTSTSLGRPVKVRLGEYNLMKNDDGAYPVDYGIAEIITHPQYKPPSKYHDIALLKLTRKVKFFKHIRPACLYLDENLNTNKAIATGWGRMFYDGNVSEVLQKVVLSIVDQNTCNQLYKVSIKTEVLSRGIVDSQLCAGELSGGKDTCQGDSGGPLSITNTKCIHHIIGVTSFGKSCALPNSTGVYTKVSAYVPWIESIVWPNELQG